MGAVQVIQGNPLVQMVISGKDGKKARIVLDSDGEKVCGEPYTHMLYVDTWSERKQEWVEGDDLPFESLETALESLNGCIKWADWVCATGKVYEGQFDGFKSIEEVREFWGSMVASL